MVQQHNEEHEDGTTIASSRAANAHETSRDPLAAHSVGFSTWWRVGVVFVCAVAVALWVVLVFEGAIREPFAWIITR